MGKGFFQIIVALAALRCLAGAAAFGADPVPVSDLSYEDGEYRTLSASTVASKNRMIKKTRKGEYAQPVIYRYTLKPYEDIWTIIAKTSLNIDTIATLNRLDFIGTVRQDAVVLLPDTLGVFVEREGAKEAASGGTLELSRRFRVESGSVLAVDDPLKPGETLLFVPEVELSFLERSYLSGVVFHAPLMGSRSSGFGKRVDPFVNEVTFHGGIDIAAQEGKTVRASRWGTVSYAGEQNGYGKLVVVRHELGYYTFYGHLMETAVAAGDNVETGQILGRVGTTGRTTGPHLHFEIRRGAKQLDPGNIPFFLEHN